MSPLNIVQTLKHSAQIDPVLKDVMLMFATRERARFQISLGALWMKMKREGFPHSRAQYAVVLTSLAELGVGLLDHDPKGRVRGLKGMKYRIPQLGASVIEKADLVAYRRRPQYQAVHAPLAATTKTLPVLPVPTETYAGVERRSVRPYQTSGSKLILTYVLNDKPVNIPVPASLTPLELADLIVRLTSGEANAALTVSTATPPQSFVERRKTPDKTS